MVLLSPKHGIYEILPKTEKIFIAPVAIDKIALSGWQSENSHNYEVSLGEKIKNTVDGKHIQKSYISF